MDAVCMDDTGIGALLPLGVLGHSPFEIALGALPVSILVVHASRSLPVIHGLLSVSYLKAPRTLTEAAEIVRFTRQKKLRIRR